MARYQVGDMVAIRGDLELDKLYYMEDDENDDNGNGVNRHMIDMGCQIVTIADIDYCGQYRIKEDDGDWLWTDEMLLPLQVYQRPSKEVLLDFL